MRVTDERYNGMIADYRSLQAKCDEVDSLEEFVDKYGDELDIDDSNIEDGFITVDMSGDTYTIEDNDWGMEVSQTVETTDDEWRCPVEIYLETRDINGEQ